MFGQNIINTPVRVLNHLYIILVIPVHTYHDIAVIQWDDKKLHRIRTIWTTSLVQIISQFLAVKMEPTQEPTYINLIYLQHNPCNVIIKYHSFHWRNVSLVATFVPTSKTSGLNLKAGASCWKVDSYLLMPSSLQCNMHWFPPPVKLSVAIWPKLLNAT